jgi:chromate transporter
MAFSEVWRHAFTMPSALILLAFALGAAAFTGPVAEGFLYGLLVAVAVVAQAIGGMARTLTPDRARGAIALAAIAVVVIVGGSIGQIAAIVLGALAGLLFCRGEPAPLSGRLRFPVSRRGGSEAFYRSGALVFGRGIRVG